MFTTRVVGKTPICKTQGTSTLRCNTATRLCPPSLPCIWPHADRRRSLPLCLPLLLLLLSRPAEIASEELKGRVFEVNLADLTATVEGKTPDEGFRKIKLICEDVQGKNVLTNFYGCSFTRDKMCSLIRKWQTLIEAYVDVKTADGYTIRMFCIAFTKRADNQIKKTCYAKSSQIRAIRKKMVDIMAAEASKDELKDLVAKL